MEGNPNWPDGARCAVTLTFDNLSEANELHRHGHAMGQYAEGAYSPRVGVWRILDALERCRVPATFFVEGWSAEHYPEVVRAIVERGHEVGGHGYMHEDWNTLDPATERALLEKTTAIHAQVTGAAPRGWRSPGAVMTKITVELLASLGYRYTSDFTDRDLPYVMEGGALVQLPFAWVLDDFIYYAPARAIRAVRDVVAIWTEEFEATYAEGGYFNLCCHPRLSGRAARAQALEGFIRAMQDHPGVWFARCEEVARWCRERGGQPVAVQ
jgi:peptidoglycan/xylan/chitin deacetylase (PgdA/CDA1 family)